MKDSARDDNTSEVMKDSADHENQDNNAKDDNTEVAAEKSATDTPSANTNVSCNDNNSNNRTAGREPGADASVIVQSKSEGGEQVSPEKKCVVSEQVEDGVKGDKADRENERTTERTEQSCSVDSDKRDATPSSDMPSATNKSLENDDVQKSSKGNDTGIDAKNHDGQAVPQPETGVSCEKQTSATISEAVSEQLGKGQQNDQQVVSDGTTAGDHIKESGPQKMLQPTSSILSSPLASPTCPTCICWSPPCPSSPLPEREEVLPPVEDFELICDSVESLRALVKKYSGEPEEIIIPAKGKKKQKTILTKPPRRKRCEIDLHQRLSVLLFELEPWEGKLIKAATRTREKMNKEVTYYQPPDPEKIINDVWASEEEPSSGLESENSSDSDTTSDSDSDSSDEKEMEIKTRDIKTEIASAAQAEVVKKPEEPDSTLAIVESVLEHEIPARRTRLARKCHIHMVKSAKKAAAKAAKANRQATMNDGATTGAGPSKKPRISVPQQTKVTAQPVHLTLENAPGSLSASLPLYSVLKSSNVLNTRTTTKQPAAVRMPVTQTQVSLQSPTIRHRLPLILQQARVASTQPSTVAGGSNITPSATLVAGTPAGNNVRYISLADLAKLNPALAQDISDMSAQAQQMNKQTVASGGGATKLGSPPAPVIGSVPGITCIMKSPSKQGISQSDIISQLVASQSDTTKIQPTSQRETCTIQRTQNATGITTVTSSFTKSSNSINIAVSQSPAGAGVQQVGQTLAGNPAASLGQAITTTVSGNAVTDVGQTKAATSLITGVTSPLLETVQLPQAGQPRQPNTSNVPSAAYKAATQIVSANDPVGTTLSSAVAAVHKGLPASIPQVLTRSAQPNIPATSAPSPAMIPVLGISQTNTAVTVTNTSVQPSIGTFTVAASGVPTSGIVTQPPVAKTTFTITVDAKMWKQIQGKPELQQQVILNHIRQKQLQQLLQQQQLATAQNKAISSPTKRMLQIESLMQQQAVMQNKLAASPITKANHMNNQQQMLQQQPVIQQYQQPVIQQPVVHQQVITSPGNSKSQSNTQLQVMLSLSQVKQLQKPQPAKQIIRMSPVKSPPAVQGNQQVTILPQQATTASGTIQLTRTQQTQQQGHVSTSAAQPVIASPVRIYLPVQQKPGGAPIQIKAAPSAKTQQQVLCLQHPHQIQGRTLIMSPTKGISVQHPTVLIKPKPTGQVGAASAAASGIQPTSQPQQRMPLPQSPTKQVIGTQNLVAANPSKPGTITVPLAAFFNRQQVKQVQQQVYTLPASSAVPVQTSQGSHGVVLQGVRSLPQPGQGTQNVVLMQSNPTAPPVQRLVMTIPQTVQGTQSTVVQNTPLLTLQVPSQGQPQTRNVVQLIQQARGQPNANILLSSLQNPGLAATPTSLASKVVLPTTQPVKTAGAISQSTGAQQLQQNVTTAVAPTLVKMEGASSQSTGAVVTTGAQQMQQSLTTPVAPAVVNMKGTSIQSTGTVVTTAAQQLQQNLATAVASTSIVQPGVATVLPQTVQKNTSTTTGVVDPESKQSLNDQDKSAQQTLQ